MKSNYIRLFRQFLIVAAFIFAGAVYSASAQRPAPSPTVTPTPDPCPSVTVSSAESVVLNEPMIFSADVYGGDPNVTPTFNWTISNGKILSGQGTSSITVDTKGIKINDTITATLDVGGYPRECSTSNSSTTSIVKKP